MISIKLRVLGELGGEFLTPVESGLELKLQEVLMCGFALFAGVAFACIGNIRAWITGTGFL